MMDNPMQESARREITFNEYPANVVKFTIGYMYGIATNIVIAEDEAASVLDFCKFLILEPDHIMSIFTHLNITDVVLLSEIAFAYNSDIFWKKLYNLVKKRHKSALEMSPEIFMAFYKNQLYEKVAYRDWTIKLMFKYASRYPEFKLDECLGHVSFGIFDVSVVEYIMTSPVVSRTPLLSALLTSFYVVMDK